MSQDLLRYYESELTFIRHLAGEFAQKYPKIAGRLDFDDKESTDPHVERLIQAFSMLTARVRHKIDDEFPEVVESLLEVMYPHYLRPLPPMAIGQFEFDSQQSRPTGQSQIPALTVLHSKPAGGAVCTFRTGYPVTVWPLRVVGAVLGSVAAAGEAKAPAGAASALRIQIETVGGMSLDSFSIDSLRFYLNGEGSPVYRLYELLLTQVAAIEVRSLSRRNASVRALPRYSIQPVGFELHEGLLPYSDRSFLGYRLLSELFAFPQKFLFVDIHGFGEERLSGLGSAFELVIFFKDSELREHLPSITQAVGVDTFQLGCTPIVNLFERSAEPIRVTHAVSEYRVIPDQHRQSTTEVYSVDQVTSSAYGEVVQVYEPLYSLRHSYSDSRSDCYWYAHRRPSLRKSDEGSEVYLSLVDLNFNPALPPVELITCNVTCTNRDFVSRVAWQKEWGEIEGEGLSMVRARCLLKPTPTVRPPLRGGLQWRLISHLSLNRLSILQSGGLEAMREILKLYCFNDDEDIRKLISGLTAMSSKSAVSRVVFDSGVTFCRGLDVEIEFDEEQFPGSGAYLMASVLERFIGLYSAINSYSRLTARSKQRRTPIRRWPARIGDQRVL